jgi:Caspase domain
MPARTGRPARRAPTKGVASNGEQRRKALLVGINDYKNPRNNLNSCVADANAFGQLLGEGYGFTEMKSLHDDDATLSNILDGLDWLFTDVTDEDRLVFYQSSHGHHITDGDQIRQVLVVRSDEGDRPFAFLHDDELSKRTQALPHGVLTITLDACFSGGMEKLFVVDDAVNAARAKVWVEDESEQMRAAKGFSLGGPISVKPFGRRPTSDPATLAAQGFLPPEVLTRAPRKDLDTGGDVQVNALLFAACQAGETAAAGVPQTNNLSAFTYALLGSIDTLGEKSSPNDLCADANTRLKRLAMLQTPLVAEPPEPPGLGSRSYITFDGTASSGPDKLFGDAADDIFDAIAAAVQKEFAGSMRGE